jgi:hypothetical protein
MGSNRRASLEASYRGIFRRGSIWAAVWLLHLTVMVYLSAPVAKCLFNLSSWSNDEGPLKVVFLPSLATRYVEFGGSSAEPLATTPPHMHTFPPSRQGSPSGAGRHASAHRSKLESVVVSVVRVSLIVRRPKSTDNEYGSASYEIPLIGAAQSSMSATPTRVPGRSHGQFVSHVLVEDAQSTKQVLLMSGQFLNCSQVRTARALSGGANWTSAVLPSSSWIRLSKSSGVLSSRFGLRL